MKGLRWAQDRLADALWWHKGFASLAKLADVNDGGLEPMLRSVRELVVDVEDGKRTFLGKGVYCLRSAELDRIRAGLVKSASAEALETARSTLADVDLAYQAEREQTENDPDIPF